jgi:hypothetical protein
MAFSHPANCYCQLGYCFYRLGFKASVNKTCLCQWNLLTENPAPQARNSLAQHSACGSVLGKVKNRCESLQGYKYI